MIRTQRLLNNVIIIEIKTKTFILFGFPIFWFWEYLMKEIIETRRFHLYIDSSLWVVNFVLSRFSDNRLPRKTTNENTSRVFYRKWGTSEIVIWNISWVIIDRKVEIEVRKQIFYHVGLQRVNFVFSCFGVYLCNRR